MKKDRTKTERCRPSQKGLQKGEKEMFRIARGVISVLLAVCLGVLFVQGDALGKVKLRATVPGDPINLDPALSRSTNDGTLMGQIFQGLVTFDLTSEPPYPVVPILAKSYEVSKDAKMITFKLHEGVQFHHGYGELTSEDVIFSLRRHMDPKIGSRAKAQYADVERIEAVDKYTVKIYMKIPSALSFIRNLAFFSGGYVLSKKACTELGKKIERMPIGTGPYYFDRWDPGEKVVLKKFDKYWRTPARIDEIEFWVMPEETVALGALEKGDLDIVSLTQLGSELRAKTIKDARILESKGGARIYIYYINHKMKPMDDVRVRRALAHALDLKEIVKRIGPQVGYFPSPLAPIVFSATDEFWGYDFDLEKSKKQLAEAGYPNGFKLKLVYKRSSLYEPIALEVKRCLDRVVDVDLVRIDNAVWGKKIKEFNHHIAAWGIARYAPFLFAQLYVTGAPQNYSQYSKPEVDEIIRKAKTATTEEDSKRYWREFQRLVTEDAVNYWVTNGKSLVAARNNVKGIVVRPTPGLVLLETAYIE